MPTPPASDTALMALSMIAYQPNPIPHAPLFVQAALMREKIVRALAQQAPIAGEWEMAWGPGLTSANMAFAAREKATGQVAVVVRGSDFNILVDWIEDFDVLLTAPFPIPGAPGARIAKGTSIALNDILAMTGVATFPGSLPELDVSLLQFLFQEATRAGGSRTVAFTGHSLGGALASVLAPWAIAQSAGWSAPLEVRACTFAAPSAGNGAFAGATAPLYGSAPSRYVNPFDVIPRAWADVASIAGLFPGGPPCPRDLAHLVKDAGVALKLWDYQQPTAGFALDTPVDPSLSFWGEIRHQHDSQTYLAAMMGQSVERVVTVPVRVGPRQSAQAPPA